MSERKIFQGDKILWGIFFFLAAISIVEVFSASSVLAYKGKMMAPILKHTAFILLSTVIIMAVSRLSVSMIKRMGGALYFLSIILLFVAIFNGKSINGASRWIPLPFGLTFQPSELMKVAWVMLIAICYTLMGSMSQKKRFYFALVASLVAILIIAKDNLSTALLIGALFMSISFVALAPGKYLAKIFLGGICLMILGYFALVMLPNETLSNISQRAPTWKNRIVSDPALKGLSEEQRDSMMYVITDDNFQESHAKIAIARGGLLGVLPGNSIERDILPQAFSDYIYAIIIEELGFLFGGLFIPAAYFVLFFRVAYLAQRAPTRFEAILLMGFGLLFLLQAMFNFIVASGIIVTGQTLPLISRGGSSYLIMSFAFGVMMGVTRRIENANKEKPVELEEETEQSLDYDERDIDAIEL